MPVDRRGVDGPFEEVYASHRGPGRHDAALAWRVRSRLAPRRGERLVDIGCGAGFVCTSLSSEGVECTGVDLSPAGTRSLALRGGRAVRGDMHHLPFPDKTFHCAVASHVLEYTPAPASLLAEVRRVLRDGGRAYVVVSDRPEGVTLALRPLARRADRRGRRRTHLDLAGLESAAREAGLRPVASGRCGHLLTAVAAVAHALVAIASRRAADALLPPLLSLDDRLSDAATGSLDAWAVLERPG